MPGKNDTYQYDSNGVLQQDWGSAPSLYNTAYSSLQNKGDNWWTNTFLPESLRKQISANNNVLAKTNYMTGSAKYSGGRVSERQQTGWTAPQYSYNDPNIAKKYGDQWSSIGANTFLSTGGFGQDAQELLNKAGIKAGDERLANFFKYDPEYGLVYNKQLDSLLNAATELSNAKMGTDWSVGVANAIPSLVNPAFGALWAGLNAQAEGGSLGDIAKAAGGSYIGGQIGSGVGSAVGGGALGAGLGNAAGNLSTQLIKNGKVDWRSVLASGVGGAVGSGLGGVTGSKLIGNVGKNVLTNYLKTGKINPRQVLMAALSSKLKNKGGTG